MGDPVVAAAAALERIAADAHPGVWIARSAADDVLAEAGAVAARLAAGEDLPLAGRVVAVKDNIDVAGLPTTAACPAYAYAPATDAPAVARLRAAGAIVVGKANLDQFATGLVGTRSPHGVPTSPAAPGRIAGGSSSGSAAAVALGLVDLALGTDTAGSGRVPAALCDVVGLKPTYGWVPTTGVVPACRSFDCVSVFAPDVAAAAVAVRIMAGLDAGDPRGRTPARTGPATVTRLGVPSAAVLAQWCDPAVVQAFGATAAAAQALGFVLQEVDLEVCFAAGDLLYGGAFVAERAEAVGAFVAAHHDGVDPIVGAIIRAAADVPATAYAADLQRLAGLRREAARTWDEVDALLVPTVPCHPTPAEVAADPVGLNTRLGRFTTGTNLLDWCAAAVPGERRPDGLPGGVSLLGPTWSDEALWAAAARLTGRTPPPPADDGTLLIVVAGAHLEGQPLNGQLTSRGGRLVRRARTAPCYRMVRLDTTPPKPGVVRVPGGGAALEVEVWALDPAGFGTFVAEVPPPLAIGTVELDDGTWASGFVCEGWAVEGAEDITAHGGWRAWLSSASR